MHWTLLHASLLNQFGFVFSLIAGASPHFRGESHIRGSFAGSSLGRRLAIYFLALCHDPTLVCQPAVFLICWSAGGTATGSSATG